MFEVFEDSRMSGLVESITGRLVFTKTSFKCLNAKEHYVYILKIYIYKEERVNI